MNYEQLVNDNGFQKWHDYEPLDVQYINYAKEDPSIIAAGHKIVDVYNAFVDANASFIFSFSDNFGDIVEDKKDARLYAKSYFLKHALLDYALCLDMSRQVIWSFIQPASFGYLMKNEYKELEKNCTSSNLHSQLNCAISQGAEKAKKIKTLLSEFENDKDVRALRDLYNSIKHHGTIHIKGLGVSFKSLGIKINDGRIKTLTRKEFSVDELEEMLWVYRQKFQIYFNSLIQLIMPEDYLKPNTTWNDMLMATLEMKEIQGK